MKTLFVAFALAFSMNVMVGVPEKNLRLLVEVSCDKDVKECLGEGIEKGGKQLLDEGYKDIRFLGFYHDYLHKTVFVFLEGCADCDL